MYLPKFKYKPARYTPGGEFLLSSKNYIGWYFETYRNEYYTGKEPGIGNELLTLIEAEEETNRRVLPIFSPQIISPTPYDMQKGYYIRYFIQHKNTTQINEVKQERYEECKDLSYIRRIQLRWVLRKPAENITRHGYIYEGAISKNKKTVEQAEKYLPGIMDQIKSYDEFVQ